MGRAHELGLVREGYLADLLVIDGDPLADIAVLQDQVDSLLTLRAKFESQVFGNTESPDPPSR